MKIVLMCVECGGVAHASWPSNATELSGFMRTLWRETRFVLSVVTAAGPLAAPGAQAEISSKDAVMAPVCDDCSRRVHGDACIDEVERSFGDAPATKRSRN